MEPARNDNEVLEKLVNMALFADFNINDERDREILRMVYQNCTIKTYKKGEIIIKEGELGSEFYMLKSGSVHISRETPAGDSIALADLNDKMNIFFGETALISDDTRTATVAALTDCTVIVLTANVFHSLCKKELLLGYRVLSVLARRMAATIRATNKDKATLYEALFDEISGAE